MRIIEHKTFEKYFILIDKGGIQKILTIVHYFAMFTNNVQ